MKTFRLVNAVFLLVALSGLSLAAQPDQSHNLSEIHPVDTDFNMSDYGIFNSSYLEVRDGLNISGYSFYNQGSMEILGYDNNANEWDIHNSDIDLNGNVLNDSSGKITLDGNVEIPDGDLNMKGNDITTVEKIKSQWSNNDQLNFDSSNVLLQVDNGAGNPVTALNVVSGTRSPTVKVQNGELNMNSNTLRIANGDGLAMGRNDNLCGANDCYFLAKTDSNQGSNPDGRLLLGNMNVSNPSDFDAAIRWDANEDVKIPNGNLNVSGGYADINSPTNTGAALDVGGAIKADGGIDTYSNVDTNGNNMTSSSGEICAGDQC